MRIVRVYVLKDPRDHQIKYVGITTAPLKARLQGHYKTARVKDWRVSRWIRRLWELNLEPVIEQVDECTEENWPEVEKRWITYYKNLGCELTNSVNGGRGALGQDYTEERRAKIREARKRQIMGPISEEHKEAIRKANSHPKSEETKARMRGKPKSEETKRRLSEARLAFYARKKQS